MFFDHWIYGVMEKSNAKTKLIPSMRKTSQVKKISKLPDICR